MASFTLQDRDAITDEDEDSVSLGVVARPVFHKVAYLVRPRPQ